MTDIPETIRRGLGRVAFIARLDEFRRLIEAGWPITLIYVDHGASTGLSYSQFARYIGKYIRTPPTRNRRDGQPSSEFAMPKAISEPPLAPLRPISNTIPELSPAKPVSTPKSREVFWHDPTSGNNREDLF